MDTKGHSILVTGGASGIGLALASRFLAAGNKVLICGRREDVLNKARGKFPGLRTHRCDLSEAPQRRALIEWALREMPDLDVLVNNAGIQHAVDLTKDPEWELNHEEIRINFEAPVHLATLLIPHLRTRPNPAIINVTSGLAFAPRASVPVYSATKAAMHSFTLSLRFQLRATLIKVIEVIPPAVDTDLGGPGLHTWGEPLEEFADAIFAGLQSDDDSEIAYKFSAEAHRASREHLDAMFTRLNQ